MEPIKGELARQLIEAFSAEEAKDILLYAIDSGKIGLEIQPPTPFSLPIKKERKKRVKRSETITLLSNSPGLMPVVNARPERPWCRNATMRSIVIR